jgi:hypothetical protein
MLVGEAKEEERVEAVDDKVPYALAFEVGATMADRVVVVVAKGVSFVRRPSVLAVP